MQIDRIDHFVLTVRDVDATCEFYSRVLGMEVVAMANGRRALQFGRQKFNLQQVGQEADLRATNPVPGALDFCLITRQPLAEVAEHVRASGVTIVDGPVGRAGALGMMQSIYFRDPDQNLVEVAAYPGEGA